VFGRQIGERVALRAQAREPEQRARRGEREERQHGAAPAPRPLRERRPRRSKRASKARSGSAPRWAATVASSAGSSVKAAASWISMPTPAQRPRVAIGPTGVTESAPKPTAVVSVVPTSARACSTIVATVAAPASSPRPRAPAADEQEERGGQPDHEEQRRQHREDQVDAHAGPAHGAEHRQLAGRDVGERSSTALASRKAAASSRRREHAEQRE